ncbi:hypothetical protein D3C86_1612340 [compost metagenome]
MITVLVLPSPSEISVSKVVFSLYFKLIVKPAASSFIGTNVLMMTGGSGSGISILVFRLFLQASTNSNAKSAKK